VTDIAPEIRKGRKQLAVVIVIGHALKHVYMGGLQAVLLPEIKIGLGLNATQLGALASSRQAMGWISTMGAGYLGDRYPQRSAMILGISLILLGVSYFLAGIASTFWVMFAAMLLVGVGPSMFHPPALGVLSRRFPDARGLAASLHGTGGTIGEMLGPLTAAGLLGILTWSGILKVSMLPAIFAGFLMWKMVTSIPGTSSEVSSFRAYLSTLFGLLKRRPLLLLVLVTALRSIGQNGAIVFLPIYLREDLEFSPTRVAVYLSLTQVIGVVSQPAMGYLSDIFGRKAILIPATVALGLLLITLKFADPGFQLTLTIVILGGFLFSLHEICIASAMDIAGGGLQATMASLIYGASFLGAISPLFAGMIVDATESTTNAFVYGGAIVLLSALILPLLKLPKVADQ
jgi:FSR family fosmidomycin resistance protein-like MFS transporter